MKDKEEFGQRLKISRKDKNLTQKELAKLVGVSAQVISNWERGYTTGIDTDTLFSISKILDCSVDYLVGISDVKKIITKNELFETKETIAAHHDGEWTEEELAEIEKFKEFIKSKRNDE